MYTSAIVDTSHHKSLKFTPMQIQYSIPIKGDRREVIEFRELKVETVEVLTIHLIVYCVNTSCWPKLLPLFGGQI
jgi:hypothetical protein